MYLGNVENILWNIHVVLCSVRSKLVCTIYLGVLLVRNEVFAVVFSFLKATIGTTCRSLEGFHWHFGAVVCEEFHLVHVVCVGGLTSHDAQLGKACMHNYVHVHLCDRLSVRFFFSGLGIISGLCHGCMYFVFAHVQTPCVLYFPHASS